MITREQVADLRPGDVVEFWHEDWPQGTTLTGPIYEYGEQLRLGPDVVRFSDGDILARYARGGHLTVVLRAPRPLYVNHDRAEPVRGDVARNEAGHLRVCQESPYADEPDPRWWGYGIQPYGTPDRWSHCTTRLFRDRGPLRLLVDGETGQVVP